MTTNPDTPPKARDITWNDLKHLRVDQEDRLMWKGNLVQVQRRLTLTTWQMVFAGAAALGTVAQGILAAYDFGTRMGWWKL